ncbi:MAG TPA: adenylate/guanylate cyclase domain-containing protein [Anaerolineales bacterium]
MPRIRKNSTPEEWWHGLLTGEYPDIPLRESRYILSILPGHTRCKFCSAPFDGAFAPVLRLMGKGQSRLTSQLCRQCQAVATEHIGGAEIELTLLFADVRGSTKLGEKMKPAEFSQLIGHFFSASSHVLLDTHAWVDRLSGDQVVGMYLPYFVGSHHVRVAVDAARELLRATGHSEPGGPWIEVGVGVHCGTAFVGTVGSREGVTDITVLGDVPNVTARLSSAAGAGEILVSEEAYKRGGLADAFELRALELKGKNQPMNVHVMRQSAPSREAGSPSPQG